MEPREQFGSCAKTRSLILFSLMTIPILCFWLATYFFNWNEYYLTGLKYKNQNLHLTRARLMALGLLELSITLENPYIATKSLSLKELLQLRSIISELDPDYVFNDLKVRSVKSGLVCPEYYSGAAPLAGWKILKCKTSKPVNELVTIMLNLRDEPNEKVEIIINDFNTSYPDIPLVIILRNLSSIRNTFKNVNFVTGQLDVFPGKLHGILWNEAARKVKTKYVLVMTNANRFSARASPLDRLLRIITEVPNIVAVGGSFRNETGHWRMGCFQTKIKNYVLEYQKGYHFSRHECMFCDFVDGPFLISATLLKTTLFDENLEADVLVQDLFLTLFKRGWVAMACPDVMFYANGAMGLENTVKFQDTWISFARKWELNRIHMDYQFEWVLHKFSCAEIGISCSDKIHTTSSYAIPVCCQEEFAAALAFWGNFCEKYNLEYQFDSGNCLGAVKMADFIPWDIDGDGGYLETNYSFIKSMSNYFKQNGFQLKKFQDPVCCHNGLKRSYFQLWTPSMKIEMWGDWSYPLDTFLYKSENELSRDTKMDLHGVWINGLPNPGLYARKRYGHECLRHAQSWSQTGKKSSWEPYEPGSFKMCKDQNHHSCLNQFPTDGSIAFLVPN